MGPNKKRLIFLCTGNSCRSQMAEGWARHLLSDIFDVSSAGIEAHGLNPLAVKVMAESGVDISGQSSTIIGDMAGDSFDFVITVCSNAERNCPVLPARVRVIHRGFDDPPSLAEGEEDEESKLSHYRRVRDEIRDFIKSLPSLLTNKPND